MLHLLLTLAGERWDIFHPAIRCAVEDTRNFQGGGNATCIDPSQQIREGTIHTHTPRFVDQPVTRIEGEQKNGAAMTMGIRTPSLDISYRTQVSALKEDFCNGFLIRLQT